MMSTILVPIMYNRFRVRLEVSKFNRDHPGQTMTVISHRDDSDIVLLISISFLTLPFTLYCIGITAIHFKFHPKPNQLIIDRFFKCSDVLQFLGMISGLILCKALREQYASEIQDVNNNIFYCGRNTDYYIVPEFNDQRNDVTVTGDLTGQKTSNNFYYTTSYINGDMEKLIFRPKLGLIPGTPIQYANAIEVKITSSNSYIYELTDKVSGTFIGNYDYMGRYQGGRV